VNKVKISAVIAEFNPLHEGHKYILRQARTKAGASHVLVVLSGNFTQRAEPAILPKHQRAEAAVHAGADAVVEIPTAYATGNAEVFAKAAVQVVNSFPHVTTLVFGVEKILGTVEETVALLKKIAVAQVNKKSEFERAIKPHLKQGMSFDHARCEVIKKMLPAIPANFIENAMKTPNNILGIEYLKELVRLKSTIKPIGVARIKNMSATAIREKMIKRRENVPNYDRFGAMTVFNVRSGVNENIYNVNQEILNLFKNNTPVTYEELKTEVPTRRFSVSRIARIALHATLGVTKDDVKLLYQADSLPYTNLLAIKSSEGQLFAALCLNEKTPLVVKGNKNKPKNSHYARILQKIDAKAELLYQTVCGLEFDNRPVFVAQALLVNKVD